MGTEEADGGESTTDSPYTDQDLATWKRREKGRLTKLRNSLIKNRGMNQSAHSLLREVAEAERSVDGLKAELSRLSDATKETRSQFFDRSAARSELKGRISRLSKWVSEKTFAFSLKREMKQCESALATLEKQLSREWKSEVESAKKLRPKTSNALKKSEATLKAVLKSQVAVRSAVPETMLTKYGASSIRDIVDRRLANLAEDPLPPEEERNLVAYVNERSAKQEAKEKEDQELAREERGLRRQVARDSKKLQELEASEPPRLKKIENLERRLEREKKRLREDRRFTAADLKGRRRQLNEREWRWLDSGKSPLSDHLIPKLRTRSRTVKELNHDLKSLKEEQKHLRSLKADVRSAEKALAAAERALTKVQGDDWPAGKAPRIGYVADAHEFEKFMAKWMRWLGWEDAKAMPVGPDEGIDVKAKGALGQAKHWDNEVGIEEVQRHNGVCEGFPKHGRVFLAKNGYTPQAIKWANDRDLPLFEMKLGNKDAGVVGSTKAAKKLLEVGAKAMGKSKGK